MDLLQSVSSKLLNRDCINIEVRNLATKLLQRVALVLLKPRLASWRYKCGFRSLEESLKGQIVAERDGENVKKAGEEVVEEDDGDIPYDEVGKYF